MIYMPFMISPLCSSFIYETEGATKLCFASKAKTKGNGLSVQFMLDDLSILINMHFEADGVSFPIIGMSTAHRFVQNIVL